MIDIEAIIETEDGSRFDRLAAVLIGTIAVLAAVLGILQMDLSQRSARAATLGARLSVQIFEGIAGGSARSSFELNSQQDAISISLTALSRALVALQTGDQNTDLEDARLQPDLAASDRLRAIASQMGAKPEPGAPLDPAARRVASTEIEDLNLTLAAQEREVDLAADLGSRSGRAVLGLSLVALAGVLTGLAAALGEGQAGTASLGTAALAALLAMAIGLWAVV